jgi:polygalacturonase
MWRPALAALLTLHAVGCWQTEAVDVTPEQYGAVGDGQHDDTAALRAALAACSKPGASPCRVRLEKSYASGPLQVGSSATELYITGTLAMLPRDSYLPYQNASGSFISNAAGIKEVKISGGGLITGLGREWWPCKYSGCWRPHMIALGDVAGLEIGPLNLTDPPNHFIECNGCTGVRVHDLYATAPNNSPNTDGMNFYGGFDQSIVDSVITNGDDCISVVPNGDPATPLCVNHPEQCRGGSLLVHNVTCKGGHGLSIGSVRHGDGARLTALRRQGPLLRQLASAVLAARLALVAACVTDSCCCAHDVCVCLGVAVKNVTFSSCVMTREKHSTQAVYSSGGLRIKSYPNGTGTISDIVYKDIVLRDVAYPLQLQARYCPGGQGSCPSGATLAQCNACLALALS